MDDQKTKPSMSIKDVSEASGMTVHTFRYYERIGLMIPVHRGSGGRRQYTPPAIEWITLLQHLRNTGMPIAEMKRFANLVREGPDTVPERLELLRQHRDAITRHINALEETLTVLDAKIAVYEAGDAVTPPVVNDKERGLEQ